MITVALIGAVTAIAVFAILMKVFAGDPPGTEKLQKADIIKQLLALSELENPPAKGPARLPVPSARPVRPTTNATSPNPPVTGANSGGSKPTAAKLADNKKSAVTALVKVSPPVRTK
jgi:hypothetical protein